MDIGFELETLHRAPVRDAAASRWAPEPEWPVLRDRLSAAWAARRAMLAAINPAARRGGSFNRLAVRALPAPGGGESRYCSFPVNPRLSGNSKPGDGMDTPLAGDSQTGDRGQ
jgi:hypothetical protein